jgi:hypothetical protein
MDVRDIVWGGIDWIHLVQDRDQWPALGNTIINFQVRVMLRNSLAERPVATRRTPLHEVR